MSQSLEPGQEIIIRIRVDDRVQPYQLKAHVAHCTQEVDRSWRIGCEFTEAIDPDTLDKILG